MASTRDFMTAELYLKAVFPVLKVLLAHDPKLAKKFKGTNGVVVIGAKNGDDLMAATLTFDGSKEPAECLDIKFGDKAEGKGDVRLIFPDIPTMNAMFKGAMNGKIIGTIVKTMFKHIGKAGLFIKVLTLLMGLMLMMPDSKPKNEEQEFLKVKLSLYMITTALSTLNKMKGRYEDPLIDEFSAWCQQPKRLYQFILGSEEDPMAACYFLVKAGNSKAGRGVYERRRPFVLFLFTSPQGALKVLSKEVEFVESAEKGYASVIGSPEYSASLNDFMTRIQALVT